MAKWKIAITRAEYYDLDVVVEAEDLDEAIKKVQAEWKADDSLYEMVTDMMVDCRTDFWKKGLASETDIETHAIIE